MPARRRGPVVVALLGAVAAVVLFLLWALSDPAIEPPPPAPPPPVATAPAKPVKRPVKNAERAAAEEIPAPRNGDGAEVHQVAPPRTDAEATPLRKPVKVHVVVRRSGGGPATGAEVLALDPLGEYTTPPGPSLRATKTAGADGRADFDIAGGTTILRFLATLEGEAAVSDGIDVGDGAERTVELDLGVAIAATVRVLRRDATPIADATVRMSSTDLLSSRAVWPLMVEAKTNGDGEAKLPAVPSRPGVWYREFRASAAGFAPKSLTVRGGDSEIRDAPVVLQLAPAVAVRGRTVDERGTPVAGAEVRVGEVKATTGADGRFDVTALPPEGGSATFDAKGFAPAWVANLRGDGGDVNLGDVVLTAGGTLRGVVVESDGKPVAGADVLLELAEAQWSRSAATDAQGRFTFEHVALAEHRLVAKERPAGRGWGSGRKVEVTGVRPGPAAAEPSAAPDLRVVLTGALSVHVSFLNDADRSAVIVTSAKLTAVETEGDARGEVAWAWSGGNLDSVRFEPGRAGVFDVTVEIPGYAPATAKAVEVAPDRETRIEVLFRRAP